jgi:hypothetical protein
MHITYESSAPTFGGKLRDTSYYAQVTNIIRILRDKTSLRLIAEHLNRNQFTTPSGLPWTRARVSEYIKSTAFTKGT